jgi:hypothetical protein
MNRILTCTFSIMGLLSVSLSYAETGEKWEIATRSEMPGMAMPAVTMNVCIKKGAEKDPANLMQRDSNCKVTDVKKSGSKITWKMKCDNNGEIMTGSGEVKHKSDSFQGVSRMTGKANGADIDMTANYQGRKLGMTCDTNDPPETAKIAGDMGDMMGMVKSQMQSAMAEQCEVSNFRAVELISARFFGPSASCAANQKYACKVINREAAKDPKVYVKLVKHDDTSDVSIATICGTDMAETTKAVCVKAEDGSHSELAEYCSGGSKGGDAGRRNSGKTSADGEESGSGSSDMMEGAKKLKGLFGF